MTRTNQIPRCFLVVSVLFSLTIALMGCVSQDRAQRRNESVLIGKPAPEFTLRDLKGNQVNLSDFRGQPVVLNFWATWCMPCRAEIPYLEAFYKKYKDQGLIIIGANTEADYMRVKQFAQPRISYTVLLDGSTQAEGYDISGIPCTYYIDKKGVIRNRSVGFAPGDQNSIEKKIKELLADADY